jgi:hypothetical protein
MAGPLLKPALSNRVPHGPLFLMATRRRRRTIKPRKRFNVLVRPLFVRDAGVSVLHPFSAYQKFQAGKTEKTGLGTLGGGRAGKML